MEIQDLISVWRNELFNHVDDSYAQDELDKTVVNLIYRAAYYDGLENARDLLVYEFDSCTIRVSKSPYINEDTVALNELFESEYADYPDEYKSNCKAFFSAVRRMSEKSSSENIVFYFRPTIDIVQGHVEWQRIDRQVTLGIIRKLCQPFENLYVHSDDGRIWKLFTFMSYEPGIDEVSIKYIE